MLLSQRQTIYPRQQGQAQTWSSSIYTMCFQHFLLRKEIMQDRFH